MRHSYLRGPTSTCKHLLMFLVTIQIHVSTPIQIQLDNEGRYQNLVINIGDQVIESQQLIDNLRTTMKEASTALTRVSRRSQRGARGFSFGQVNVVVPGSWKLAASFPPAGTSLVQNAVIRVEPVNEARGNQPYTIQPGGCGEPGSYVHLTPEYLLSLTRSRQTYGDIGMVNRYIEN